MATSNDRSTTTFSIEENERLALVGPDTPVGLLMRRYWHPVATVHELETRPTKAIRVLGESLVLFRSPNGQLGLVGQRCPHRGASLLFGMAEDRGLRCSYHGWLYDRAGACVEMPAEPEGCAARRAITVPAYPVEELGGLVFAYLGGGSPPLVPRWPSLIESGCPKEIAYVDVPCNWLQIMENSIDQVHFEWLHVRFTSYVRALRGEPSVTMGAKQLEPEYLETEYGFVKRFRVQHGGTDGWTTNGPLVFPTMVLTGPGRMPCFQIRVPLDDVTTRQYFYTTYLLPPSVRDRLSASIERDVLDGIRVPSYRIDLPRLDEPDYAQLTNNVWQDVALLTSQGALYDRTQENLGRSDRGIALFRSLLRRELAKIERGEDPINVLRDRERNDRLLLPRPNMAALHRDGLYPKTNGAPAGNVQGFSPFLARLSELGVNLEELLASGD